MFKKLEFCFWKHVVYSTFFDSVGSCCESQNGNESKSFKLTPIVAEKLKTLHKTFCDDRGS